MGKDTAIVVSWITEAMKASAHNYYHQRCYTGSVLSNQQVREIAMGEIGIRAMCCVCWQPIRRGAE